ncbi:DUF2339 domain-containing protein [Spirosoma sordidisoli]|uniref:Glycosyltransferase RgtA/B/C/D-like domain-containing protein n=1 Tax=Spirosoma sordidisoli TaxID=2502893 RepID=A0A4Q2UL70_9BACT|nr:hypothetical protein [Spirosoma sordidisoli]RYC69452.1 hypothetical protein EQG79_12655 [Spirosoma sordidisoli]
MSEKKGILVPLILFVVILVYYTLVGIFSQNIPYADDLSLLASLYDLSNQGSVSATLSILFSFHNEHRLLLPRLVTIGLTALNGGVIDFRWWVWLGNAFLLVPLAVFYQVLAGRKISPAYLVPIALLLFQPLHTELVYWGMASLQNLGVLALAVITLYLAAGPLSFTRLALVLGLTLLSMLTGANGMLLIPAVAFVWLLRRQYWLVAGWLIIGSLAIGLYWWGFDPAIQSGIGAEQASTLFEKAQTLLGLLGALVESQRYQEIPMATGLLLVLAFGIPAARIVQRVWTQSVPSADRGALFMVALGGFLLMTMAAIAVSRQLDAALFVTRYKIYPLLLLICVYLMMVLTSMTPARWMLPACVVVGLAINVIGYWRSLPRLEKHQAYMNEQLINWERYHRVDAPTPFMRHYYEQRWTAAHREGLYLPPAIR